MATRVFEIEEIERFDGIDGWPTPEAQDQWYGEARAEEVLLDAYRSRRMHHAWLLTGPKGIGKATLAYRFARFAFAHPDPSAPAVAAAKTLAIPENNPAFRRVAARAHPNLLALERPYDEDRKRYRTELTVAEIRRTVSFFGSTAAETGWRIAIVDPADDMNPSAANALLKILEEPPARALFFVIGHVAGKLLPTIRSRCRRLDVSPLPPAAIEAAVLSRAPKTKKKDLALASQLADGSLRRAILLIEEEGIDTYRAMSALLAGLPDVDVPAMHAFADQVSGRGNDDAYHGFLELLRGWLARRVRRQPEPDGGSPAPGVPLERWAQVWEKVQLSSEDAEEYNLDRKQLVLSIFMTLARETRM